MKSPSSSATSSSRRPSSSTALTRSTLAAISTSRSLPGQRSVASSSSDPSSHATSTRSAPGTSTAGGGATRRARPRRRAGRASRVASATRRSAARRSIGDEPGGRLGDRRRDDRAPPSRDDDERAPLEVDLDPLDARAAGRTLRRRGEQPRLPRATRARARARRRPREPPPPRRPGPAITTSTICVESSRSSARAAGRVHAGGRLPNRQSTPRLGDFGHHPAVQRRRADLRALLRRAGHAPCRDGRLLRARVVRAAHLPRALGARLLRPGRLVERARRRTSRTSSPTSRSSRSCSVVDAVQRNAAALSVVGAVALLWSSLSLFSALESAFNIIYGRPNRPFLRGKALATST